MYKTNTEYNLYWISEVLEDLLFERKISYAEYRNLTISIARTNNNHTREE